MPFAVLTYCCLMLAGGSALLGAILHRLWRRNEAILRYANVFGFGLFPAIVAYGGFMGIWSMPWITEIVGGLLAVAGLWWVLRTCVTLRRSDARTLAMVLAVPVCILLVLCITKFGYLQGGYSDPDDGGRSIILTGTFAANALKPGYPYDLSLPIVYPYYLFESSAFTYRALRGATWPSIPVLAVTLCSIGVSLFLLRRLSAELFPKHAALASFLVPLLLACSSLRAFLDPDRQFFNAPPNGWTVFLHSGYHYLFSATIGLLGLHLLSQALQRRNFGTSAAAALSFALSFGFGGFPAVWIVLQACGLIVAALWYLGWKRVAGNGLPFIAMAVGIGCIVLAPQAANFLPRMTRSLYLTAPHVWFARDSVQFAHRVFPGVSLLPSLAYGFIHLFIVMGPFLLAGFCSSIVFVVQACRKREAEELCALLPFAVAGVVTALTFTVIASDSFDWEYRGSIVTLLVSAILATQLILIALEKRLVRPLLLLPLFLILSVGFLQENAGRVAHPLGNETWNWNARIPLEVPVYTGEYSATAGAIQLAGRTVIGFPPVAHSPYLVRPDVLVELGIVTPVSPTETQQLGLVQYKNRDGSTAGAFQAFLPCHRSWYGNSTPRDLVALLSNTDNRDVTIAPCSEVHFE